MIKHIAFATVWVLDQDRAKDFYVNTLGFEVRSDQQIGPFRWLTVAAPTIATTGRPSRGGAPACRMAGPRPVRTQFVCA